MTSQELKIVADNLWRELKSLELNSGIEAKRHEWAKAYNDYIARQYYEEEKAKEGQ